uniref:Peptidase S1 domain-containing protein n=1 Tax=Xiphophorus couchianus TaxID=32473 RepID=A0A3B5MCI5_9TELE
IIRGQPCSQNERRYHVLLVATDRKGQSFCGGSLLRNGWILTAAHCWESGQKVDAYLGWHLGNREPIRIPLGFFKRPKIYKVGFWFFGKQHDLMLLKLPDTATIPQDVTTIQLPDCSHRYSFFPGPGFTRDLQCANINKVRCPQQQIFPRNKYIYKYLFCGQTPGVDLCSGDSGGGIEYNGRIYGIHVLGGKYPCRTPAAFMDLCHQDYLSWIENTIGPAPNPGYDV